MSTEEVLMEKIRRKPKFAVRISRNSLRTRKDENGFNKDDSFDRENGGYKGKFKKNVNFRGSEEFSGYERRKFYERGKIDDRENRGYKGKLKNRENYRGMESGEERSGEKFHDRGKVRTRKDENRFNKGEVFDRENGYRGKLKKNENFRGMESGEERSGERFPERGRLRTRKDDSRFKRDEIFDRENGYKEKLKKNVNYRGRESGEERSGEKFNERRKLRTCETFRTFDCRGRKKRVYADTEGMDESGKLWSGEEISKKKTLFKKGEKKVRDETVEEKIVEEKNDHRTIWDLSKLKKAKKSKDKLSNENLKNKQEIDERKVEVVSPSISDMKKPGLDGDAEKLDDRRWKKKKRVIRIDPYDISNKRLDDSIGVDGIKEEKKKDSEKKPEMSLNAQFRAIQPSPSILTFVEKNLLGRRRMIDIKRAGYNIELPAPLDNIPFSKSLERENIEENVFRNRLEFFAAAKVSSSFPPPNLPEIAFAGKSNVGKSSLLNALTRQWGVVRTSDKPGHTQTINFFSLGTKLSLVDLPGYGFAYAKEEVKESWEDLVKEYVSTRVGLKQVCLLIDTKWGMKPRDLELIELMERSKTKYQIVLTKTDTVFPIDVARRAMQIEESLLPNKSVIQPLMMASSKSGAGIRSLRTVLANVARFVKI
ncbi:putative GTP-binding protein [Trifolium pratense]|uniref:Putative GTP-binding protein n=1 Tax=Trifolium pratense TaxID=57577 RepID=A0A2K3P6K3_TRIPR|nr:putative GTP-binding protein [Trifolium pratense]